MTFPGNTRAPQVWTRSDLAVQITFVFFLPASLQYLASPAIVFPPRMMQPASQSKRRPSLVCTSNVYGPVSDQLVSQ